MRWSTSNRLWSVLLALTALFSIIQLRAFAQATRPKAENRNEKLKGKLARLIPPDGWEVQPARNPLESASFIEFKGKNCQVRTTVSREAAQDIGNYHELYLELFRKIFKAKFIINAPLRIVVFAHREEFDGYYESAYKTSEKWTRMALYSPHKKETWILLKGEGEKKSFPLETAKHEITHHMLHFFTGQTELPPWFNEGTACFFQYWEVDDTPEANIAKNFRMARQGDYGYFPSVIQKHFSTELFLPPARLLRMDYDAFHVKDADSERLHYSESWALVNFLTATKTGQTFFDRIVTELRGGKKLEKILAPETLDSLNTAWFADIENRMLPGLREAVSGEKEEPESGPRKSGE